ncbi:MAG: NYN domain-containing protein [Chloroflexota bacterium]|nr:NYN domain-containing protein [Chloroflexota bacterium]
MFRKDCLVNGNLVVLAADLVCVTIGHWSSIHWSLVMPLLIDGHNLIGRLPNLRLDDPDDEAKLVARLRAYCARTGKHATVIFDRGLPGGPSRELSGGGVKVVFAATGHTADGILRERVRRARDPRGLTVVTSDHEVIAVVQAGGARVKRSEEFAAQLSVPRSVGVEKEKKEEDLSAEEVKEWLHIFGGVDRE